MAGSRALRVSALLLLAVRTGAFFERGSDVVVIDSVAKWKEHNPAKSNHLWVISFYREGCGFCVLLEPELQKAATKLRKLVYFGAVDVEKHRTVADVIVKKHGVKIEGRADDRRPDFVKRLAGDDWSAAPDAFAARRVLLFTEKRSPTGLFKGLASRFRGEIDFGSVYCGDAGANEGDQGHAQARAVGRGLGFRVPLGKKPSFMRLEFALMPFAVQAPTLLPKEDDAPAASKRPEPDDSGAPHPEEARFRAGKEARRRHGHHRKKHRKPEVYVDSSWQDSVWDDGEL
ncbi:hypothetical protein JL720_9530 [Aureococcus anophagefferens]|nr:hypothetical protein JL720_9530 [Aureococcus anophagefferens]